MSSPGHRHDAYTFTPPTGANCIGTVLVCEFCGAVVSLKYKEDHISWHETIDLQAASLLRRSLEDLAGSFREDET